MSEKNRQSTIVNNKSSRVGRRPYGYYPDELAVIDVILLKNRRRKGAEKPPGPWQIARELNSEGYEGPAGGAWCGITVKRIIDRTKNTGDRRQNAARRKKENLESGDYLSKEDVAKCRSVLNDSDRVLFETLLGSGLRASECCVLKIGDIGVWEGKSQIDVKCGKGKKGRAVHIGSKLRDILREYIANADLYYPPDTKPSVIKKAPLFVNKHGRIMTYQNLFGAIKNIRERSEVQSLHPHALRHTFAVFLYNYKSDLEYVRQQLGHASIATTQIYAKTLDELKLEQMDGFEASLDP